MDFNFKTYLNEALSLSVGKKYTKISNEYYKTAYDSIFKGKNRIYLKLKKDKINFEQTETYQEVQRFLTNLTPSHINEIIENNLKKIEKLKDPNIINKLINLNNLYSKYIDSFYFKITDYLEGKCSLMLSTSRTNLLKFSEGDIFNDIDKNVYNIGKLLQKYNYTNILEKFKKDPLRFGDMSIVISRHPYDIAGMSTDRGWRSCMNLKDGCNRHYVEQEIIGGSLIAYLISSNDRNIKNPFARILIKPYFSKTHGNRVLKPSSIYGLDITYSNGESEFKNTLSNFLDENFNNNQNSGKYVFSPISYNDGDPQEYINVGKNFIKFIKKEINENGFNLFNSNSLVEKLKTINNENDKTEISKAFSDYLIELDKSQMFYSDVYHIIESINYMINSNIKYIIENVKNTINSKNLENTKKAIFKNFPIISERDLRSLVSIYLDEENNKDLIEYKVFMSDLKIHTRGNNKDLPLINDTDTKIDNIDTYIKNIIKLRESLYKKYKVIILDSHATEITLHNILLTNMFNTDIKKISIDAGNEKEDIIVNYEDILGKKYSSFDSNSDSIIIVKVDEKTKNAKVINGNRPSANKTIKNFDLKQLSGNYYLEKDIIHSNIGYTLDNTNIDPDDNMIELPYRFPLEILTSGDKLLYKIIFEKIKNDFSWKNTIKSLNILKEKNKEITMKKVTYNDGLSKELKRIFNFNETTNDLNLSLIELFIWHCIESRGPTSIDIMCIILTLENYLDVNLDRIKKVYDINISDIDTIDDTLRDYIQSKYKQAIYDTWEDIKI